MTIAPLPPSARRTSVAAARLELAWTLSASALAAGGGYSSAVLHVVCEWDASDTGAPACSACVVRGAARREVRLQEPISLTVSGSGRWKHVTVRADGRELLAASFESGRLAYCTSAVPALAGLRGGTYDAPTGLLDLYADGP